MLNAIDCRFMKYLEMSFLLLLFFNMTEKHS